MTALYIFCRLDDLNLELDTLKKQVEDLYPEIQSIIPQYILVAIFASRKHPHMQYFWAP